MPQSCHCGSGKQYTACCLPYLQHTAIAPTPEALMRSRYCAYVVHDVDYLIATWDPAHQPEKWRSSITESCQDTQWQKLNVLATSTGRDADEGYVEFAARYTDASQPGRTSLMRERSRFLRRLDRWYYVDGVHLQTGRNDRCPCGSDKKYKQCCGRG